MLNQKKNKSISVIYSKLFGSTFGQISLTSFIIAVLTGAILAIPFDVSNAYDSVSLILLTNPAGSFLRNLHYWSAQFFLLFTLLHIWDHLRKSTEQNVNYGAWLRLTISLLAVFFVMISGFILKGDMDSIQAKRIFTSLLEEIPLIGNIIAHSLLGREGSFQLVYVHHIATATIFIWIIIIEHSRILWPKLKAVVYFSLLFIIFSVILPANLHDNQNPVMKGPWYFLGLQELFHYFSRTQIILTIIFLGLLLFYLIRWIRNTSAKKIKHFLLALTLIYSILIIIGYFFRGENWEFSLPWHNPYFTNSNYDILKNAGNYFVEFDSKKEIPKVLGRREGCLYCHSKVEGFSPSHSAESIGCASCHLGNPFSLDKSSAHSGMIKIPGNLDEAHLTCGTSECHPDIPNRVNKSIMSSMSGVINVDKYVFDENSDLNKLFHLDDLEESAADTHLKNLCVSCHLGKEKSEYGPVTQLSRGGGCNACHLNYDQNMIEDLDRLNSTGTFDSLISFSHPSLSIKITNEFCFGCHSRSGRISTNYEGWHETQFSIDSIPKLGKFKTLEDDRVFEFIQADIHFEKGLDCIDCHTSSETMGNGTLYAHEEDQQTVSCEDCHFTGQADYLTVNEMNSESRKLIELRKTNDPGRRYLISRIDSIPLLNTYISSEGALRLIGKNSGKELPLNPPKFICTSGRAHDRLSCSACHTAWAPQCVGCHTDFNPAAEGINHLTDESTDGEWEESVGEYFAEPPTLGVFELNDESDAAGTIKPFLPGMILSIDRTNFTRQDEPVIFKRLFAPAGPHTISIEGRSCKSCHNDPLAIGYGRGSLKFLIKKGKGHWSFTPKYGADEYDGLPQDSWIGFLDPNTLGKSTRTNARSFNIEEQKKILTVGACLVCHKQDSKIMKNSLINFEDVTANISEKCTLPEW